MRPKLWASTVSVDVVGDADDGARAKVARWPRRRPLETATLGVDAGAHGQVKPDEGSVKHAEVVRLAEEQPPS